VEHLGVGLQVGVADLAVQLDNLLQLGDCPVELPPGAVDHRHVVAGHRFPGPVPDLPPQLRELETVLEAGPAASGWDEDQSWTLARIAEVIGSRFRVGYTLAGVDLLLDRIGWSVQVPARRAAERDEARIAAWREETWPVVKGPRRTWVPG
jgi:hypothetical protein